MVRKRAPLDTARSALDSAAAPKTLATYITLWHYAIDPLILAVSAKTWAGLSLEDRNTVRQVGKAIMELQKDEAREAPVKPSKLVAGHVRDGGRAPLHDRA